MKTIQCFTATAILISTMLFTSCSKKDSTVNNTQNADIKDAQKLEQFFSTHAPQYESFSVSADAGGILKMSSGTEIKFPAGIFRKKNGTVVTGQVTIRAKDVLAAGNMILSNKPTLAGNGQMLESFGEIMVFATQGLDTLQLAKPNTSQTGATVMVPIGTATGAGRKEIPMWDGDTSITYTQNGYNHENASVSVPVTNNYAIVNGMIWNQINGFGYSTGTQTFFPLDNLNKWTNCDIFYSDPRPKTTVLGYFGDKYNDATGYFGGTHAPSLLFFKTKNTNTLINFTQIIMLPSADKKGFLSYQNSIPIGQEGTFLAISAKNGKFYAEMRDITIAAPASGKNYVPVSFSLNEVTEVQMLSLINNMSSK